MTATQLEFHPLAEAFPLIEGADFDELVESIKAVGQIETVKVFEGKVLDGRNRYRACLAAGVEPVCVSVEPEDPKLYVIGANKNRRHQTRNELARAVLWLEDYERAEAKERMREGGRKGGKKSPKRNAEGQAEAFGDDKGDPNLDQPYDAGRSLERLADAAGLSKGYVHDVKRVEEKASEPLRDATRRDEIKPYNAALLAEHLTAEEQADILAQGADAANAKAKEIRSRLRQERAAARKAADPYPDSTWWFDEGCHACIYIIQKVKSEWGDFEALLAGEKFDPGRRDEARDQVKHFVATMSSWISEEE